MLLNTKSIVHSLLFLILVVTCLTGVTPVQSVKGGGGTCAGCVIGARVLYQIIEEQEPNIEKALFKVCQLFSNNATRAACEFFMKIEGPILIQMLQKGETPDVICLQLKACTDDKCRLYPKSPFKTMMYKPVRLDKSTGEPWWKKMLDKLIEPFYQTFNTHMPLVDVDGDKYSVIKGFRGTGWRGKDCNDYDAKVYPGRRFNSLTDDPNIDNNCNGIYGIDPESGKSYEELFCSNIPQRGVVVLGDSASAHFRIPQQLVQAPTINKQTYSHLLGMAELEFDWPQLSGITGYMDDNTGLIPATTNSIYMKLRERNRCIHRDFQNIAVNGARTSAMKEIVKTMSRNQQTDQPLLVFYSLVGNDVCNGHQDVNHFTPPEDFYNNVVGTLDYLETVLPANSYVVFVGLADGGLLYDFLKNVNHPLGVPYPAMYDFLNCIDTTPCYGWLNTNATVRNATTEHAKLLSSIYPKIINDKKSDYKQFTMLYHEFPLTTMWQQYVKNGGKAEDLIEPMDGFHPSQMGSNLIAQGLWDWLLENHPDALGPVNPHNADIERLFGNQGGY